MTLAEMLIKGSKNEPIQLWVDDTPVTGIYYRDEILSGLCSYIDNADDYQVVNWYSMTGRKLTSYTLIEVRKVECNYAE